VNKSIRAFSALAIAAISSSASQAEEARYIVKLHSPSLFREVDAELAESVRNGLQNSDVFGNAVDAQPRLFGTRARVLSGLKALNMIVVDSMDEATVEALSHNPDVAYIEKEFFFDAPRMPNARPLPPRTSQPIRTNNARPSIGSASELTWGLENIRATGAWNAVNNGAGKFGEGVRVLVIDTGIDRDHIDIKANFEQGRNFITSRPGPLFRDRLPLGILPMAPVFPGANNNDPAAAYDYFDQVGHGTHVAGTIAGVANNQGVVGVAPRAKILAGRVCGKLGCSSTAIVAAIDWATTARADVVNMSLGGPVPSRAQEDALKRLETAGVTVVAASGNDGAARVSYPSAWASVISVGAIDAKEAKAEFSNWGPELDIVAPGVDVKSSVPTGSGRESRVKIPVNNRIVEIPSTSFVGAPEILDPFEGELAFAGLGKPEDFGSANVRGKIALLARGEIPFADKVKNAIAAGAVGVAIYNNVDGLLSGALTQDGSTVAIPVVAIEKDRGEELKRRVGTQKVTMSIQTIKTDHAGMQGTSMASPHVAGLVALVKAANKDLKPAQIREIVARSARAVTPNPENKFGAGIADAEAAVREALKLR